MHEIRIQSEEFLALEKSFRKWLEMLNFERSTVRYAPVNVREFFYWLERHKILSVNNLTIGTISDYFYYLSSRENRVKGGRLSRNYLRTHLTALRKLSRYLRENYLHFARPMLTKGNEQALFLSQRGNRLCEEAMVGRLKALKEKALIDRPGSLHTLRHSIATHLLQSGMTLEEVSRFLGHSSLESTQIYTHLANE